MHLPTKHWHLTPAGWFWLLTLSVILAIGIAKNINLLTLLGLFLLVLLVLNAVVAGRKMKQLAAHRHLDPQFFAGATGHFEVRLKNRSIRACRGVRIEDEGMGESRSWFLDLIEGHARHVFSGQIRLPARGRHEWGAIWASSGHPFGLVRRRVVLCPPTSVLVLPAPDKVDRERLRQQLRGGDPRGERVRRRGWRHEGAQADFHGLRPYRPGDSPRWIHWRTTARRGEIMVREFEDVPGDDIALILAPGGDIERSITAAASVCWEWCRRRGDRIVFLAGSTMLDDLSGPEHARAILECLAELPTGYLPEPDTSVVRRLPANLAVVVVCDWMIDPALKASLGERITHFRFRNTDGESRSEAR